MTNYNLLKSKMALVGDTMGDLAEYLKKELYGNTALGVLKQWQ